MYSLECPSFSWSFKTYIKPTGVSICSFGPTKPTHIPTTIADFSFCHFSDLAKLENTHHICQCHFNLRASVVPNIEWPRRESKSEMNFRLNWKHLFHQLHVDTDFSYVVVETKANIRVVIWMKCKNHFEFVTVKTLQKHSPIYQYLLQAYHTPVSSLILRRLDSNSNCIY